MSDGTPENTGRVTSLRSGREGAWPSLLTALNGRCLFFAPDRSRLALWSSDGTAAGTRKLAALKGASQVPSWMLVAGRRAYFLAPAGRQGTELWVTDGTPRGTVPLDVVPGRGSPSIEETLAVGPVLYFGLRSQAGVELWSTKGTQRTTRRHAGEIFTATLLGRGGLAGGRLVFPAHDHQHGLEMWSAGSLPGDVTSLGDIYPGAGFSHEPTNLGTFGAELLFTADDGTEDAVWRTDGTRSGTRKAATLCTAGQTDSCVRFVATLAELPERKILVGSSWAGAPRLLAARIDGASVTLEALELPESSGPVGFPATVVGSVAVFKVENQSAAELWASDGTPAGTGPLHHFATLSSGGSQPVASIDR